jgi:olefin beta-lactone synthetase
MNAASLFQEHVKSKGPKVALWFPEKGSVTFAELGAMIHSAQKYLKNDLSLEVGDSVLLLEPLGPRLYASVLACLSLGFQVLLVEPWLKVALINYLLQNIKPKVFLCNWNGTLWGLTINGVRKIPHWVNTSKLFGRPLNSSFETVSLAADFPGIITFTSGTTGLPKGVIRAHGYMLDQIKVINQNLKPTSEGADLCIFANFALLNLANGRTSLIVTPKWKETHLKAISTLTGGLAPHSLTAGPGFLLRLMELQVCQSLQSVHIGGALCDNRIFKKAFNFWPATHFSHLYGSTEAEPVALIDAYEAVALSEKKGYFQNLCFGKPVSAIEAKLESDSVWIVGPHVCKEYLFNEAANRENNRLEGDRVWHKMGDRIIEDQGYWWYKGREKQKLEEFKKEQRIYSLIQSSAGFLFREHSGEEIFYCQNAEERSYVIRHEYPELKVINCRIVRDRRHHARIDREATRKSIHG